MKSYGFCRCENPRDLKQPYTGDIIKVPCGYCKACLLSKRDKMSMQCKSEELDHVYCMFVTLTYDNKSVPTMFPVRDEINNEWRFYNNCERFNSLYDDEQLMFTEPDYYHPVKKEFWIYSFLNKVKLNGLPTQIPYTNIRDVQLFLKRLRKNLSRFTDEKIRFYAVSEYGPVHFRPHWHILLYFDTQETLFALPKCIEDSWTYKEKVFKKTTQTFVYKIRKFGRVDYSLSKGKCDSYVAGYVNCVGQLPHIFANSSIKPIQSHSKFFACSLLQDQKETIYELDDFRTLERSFVSNGKLISTELPCSFKSRFFPRCRRYNKASYSELCQSYTIYPKARDYFNSENINILASNIYFGLTQGLHICSNNSVLNYFRFICSSPDYRLGDFILDNSRLIFQRIKTDLYLSKHFHNFVCNGDSNKHIPRINMIKRYWDYDAQKKLRTQYEQQQEFINDFPEHQDYLPFYYNNYIQTFSHYITDLDDIYDLGFMFDAYIEKHQDHIRSKIDLINHPMRSMMLNDSFNKYNDSIKHKKLNDLNKVLLYE